LPVYHRVLMALQQRNVETVSSGELATESGVNSAKLRKDLSYLGSYGTRGVGYDVAFLVYQIARELGLTRDWPVVIVGIGNLGRALANYGGFASRGFRVVGLLDCDGDTIGQQVGPVLLDLGVDPSTARAAIGAEALSRTVRDLDELEQLIVNSRPAIAVIATPADAAQDVCDRLVAAGLKSILNFAPVVLAVPSDVEVRKVDLATELQILAFHEQRRNRESELAAAPSAGQRDHAQAQDRREDPHSCRVDSIDPLDPTGRMERAGQFESSVQREPEEPELIPSGGKL
jgi:redox-sensing transcriptional repressor